MNFPERCRKPHQLQKTSTRGREAIVVELRKTLLLPLGDSSVMARMFINHKVLRFGLDHFPRHYGLSSYPKSLLFQADKAACMQAYALGSVRIKGNILPQSSHKDKHQYLSIALDGAGRSVSLQQAISESSRASRTFLNDLLQACPLLMHTVVAVSMDSIKAITDRFVTREEDFPPAEYAFDTLCRAFTGEQHVTYLSWAWTNSLERHVNGRIQSVRRLYYHMVRREDSEKTPALIVSLRNHDLGLAARTAWTLMQAMKQRHQGHQHLFVIRSYDCPGFDSEAGPARVLFSRHKAIIYACILNSALWFLQLVTTSHVPFNRSFLVHPIVSKNVRDAYE